MHTDLGFLNGEAIEVARQLIGWRFYHNDPRYGLIGGVLSETEAYHQDDAASHAYNGRTERNSAMFGPAGRLYVYFTYGMHWCANIVTGSEGVGQGVLLRALIPDQGLDVIRARRSVQLDASLTNGPAKLCQALGITRADNGQPITAGNQLAAANAPSAASEANQFILLPPNRHNFTVVATPRIGITKNRDVLLRFVMQT